MLLQQGRVALDAVTAAGRRAQRAGPPDAKLQVAAKPSGEVAPLQALLRAYHAGNPELPAAEVTICGYGEPAAMLCDGRADVALLRNQRRSAARVRNWRRCAAADRGHATSGRGSGFG